MRATRKRAPTNSSIEKIANVTIADWGGPRVTLSRQRARRLAKAVLSLLRENRRLTLSNDQLLRQVQGLQAQLLVAQRQRHQALQQLLELQLQTFNKPVASARRRRRFQQLPSEHPSQHPYFNQPL